jgi:hypothetical protein
MLVIRCAVRIEWGDCDPAGDRLLPRYFAFSTPALRRFFERALGMTKHDYLRAYDFSGHR